MSIGRALGLGSAIILISGCQSWGYKDVDKLPPTAALPDRSEFGKVQVRYFDNVSGSKVSALTGLQRYPDAPDEVAEINSLQILENRGDNYGALIRGYIIPPSTGEYQFFVSGDDETQFLFSDSTSPADAKILASVPDWSPREQYGKYSSQSSPLKNLIGGQRYYFEIRFKEAAGGDHFSLAWQGPGFSQQVISGRAIASWAKPTIADDMNTEQAYSLGYRVGYVDGSEGVAFNYTFPPLDNDGDGLYDNWEVIYGLDPNNPGDGLTDQDNDLLPAADEFLIGTSPVQTDTDSDGIPDGFEYAYGLNPRDPGDAASDSDGDGFSNLEEYQADTDIDDAADMPIIPSSVPGMVGQYFAGRNFDQFLTVRKDANVDFTWGRESPSPEVPADNFSVRWSGSFTAPHNSGSQEYRFTTTTDDGARLYIDGERVINDWNDHGAKANSYSTSFGAGETASVTMEYYDHGYGAVARFNVTNVSSGQSVPLAEAFSAPDPATTNSEDTDGDGIPDTWELRNGLNPWTNDSGATSNSSGVTNLQAYQSDLNPWTLEQVSSSAPDTSTGGQFPTSSATLTWIAPLTRQDGTALSLSEIEHYEIDYGQSPDELNLSVTVPGDSTSYTFDDLDSGTWYFTIQVIDSQGLTSSPSETVSKSVQ